MTKLLSSMAAATLAVSFAVVSAAPLAAAPVFAPKTGQVTSDVIQVKDKRKKYKKRGQQAAQQQWKKRRYVDDDDYSYDRRYRSDRYDRRYYERDRGSSFGLYLQF